MAPRCGPQRRAARARQGPAVCPQAFDDPAAADRHIAAQGPIIGTAGAAQQIDLLPRRCFCPLGWPRASVSRGRWGRCRPRGGARSGGGRRLPLRGRHGAADRAHRLLARRGEALCVLFEAPQRRRAAGRHARAIGLVIAAAGLPDRVDAAAQSQGPQPIDGRWFSVEAAQLTAKIPG